MIRFLALMTMMAMWGGSVQAQGSDIPIPVNKADIIAENNHADEIEQTRARQQALRDNLNKVDDEIDALRSAMVKAARDVKVREAEMNTLEDQIDGLQGKRRTLQVKLQKEHKDIASLATALARLRRIPPEAIMAKPGAPLDTAEIAMILRDAVGPVRVRALALAQDLDELARLEAELKTRQIALKDASARILTEQTKLADLVRRRESAYANIKSDLKEQERDLARLAEDAADFHDLIGKLEARNKSVGDAAPAEPRDKPRWFQISTPPPKRADQRALASFGDIQMPISGIIRLKFGASDVMGSASQGLKIEGRAGGIVVAPMNGVVRYKGHFKNYGNMVIIEHAKNYHSLVAGLAKIDTVVGQSVVAGEPLGILGVARAARPSVYYELRQKGKPVNPARLFPDLG